MPSNRKRRIRQLMAESNMSYQAVINSLEGRGGQANPIPWLIEKTALALDEAARLVDLANEQDTNAWYREQLKGAAHRMIGRLAPVVGVLCDTPDAASTHEKWEPIAEGGTPAVRAWIEENGLEADLGTLMATAPPFVSTPYALAQDRSERIEKPPISADLANRGGIQARLLRGCASWLLRNEVSSATQRLLLWMMSMLEGSEYVDIVVLSRRFLATDIGATCAETEDAYRTLCESGILELADYVPAPGNPDCFCVRLTTLGDNESKYPRPYVRQDFGPAPNARAFPILRISGPKADGSIGLAYGA
jgi:hypothetical protein